MFTCLLPYYLQFDQALPWVEYGVRALGEGFQILQWDVINKKKKNQSKHYENSGTVILKSISIEQVSKKRRYQMTFVAKAF